MSTIHSFQTINHSKNPRLSRGIVLAITACSCLGGGARIASASIAGATLEFKHDIDCFFIPGNFPSADYGTTISALGAAAGSLTSDSTHGLIDIKNMPTAPIFTQTTLSKGDVENSTQTIRLGAIDDFVFIASPQTLSDSTAADKGGLQHEAHSDATASVLKNLEVTRLTPLGLAPAPQFNLLISAPAGAVHMHTTVEGDAFALSSITVSLIGTIENLNLPTDPVANLDSVQLFTGVIVGNKDWLSPDATNYYSLPLPDWTRLPGAHFNLKLGLQLTPSTVAEVSAVPEPTTILPLAVGASTLLLRRRPRQK